MNKHDRYLFTTMKAQTKHKHYESLFCMFNPLTPTVVI